MTLDEKGRIAALTGSFRTPLELFLMRLHQEGSLLPASGNQPIPLQGDHAWVVLTGSVDVFAVRMKGGRAAGPRRHLCRLVPGEAAFAMGTALESGMTLLGVGLAETQVINVPRSRLLELGRTPPGSETVAAMLDGWVTQIGLALAEDAALPECTLLDAGGDHVLASGAAARPRSGVLWVEVLEDGPLELIDSGCRLEPGLSVPIPEPTWIRADRAATLRLRPTLAVEDGKAAGLDWFLAAMLEAVDAGEERAGEAERARLARVSHEERKTVQEVARRLVSVLEKRPPPLDDDGAGALFTACRLVGAASGFEMLRPPARQGHQEDRTLLRAIAHASGTRTRRLRLRPGWWNEDCGPMLGFLTAGDRPVALLPVSAGAYELTDPTQEAPVRVNVEVAARLEPIAIGFVRPLPPAPTTVREAVVFGLSSCGLDLVRVALVGLGAAALSLAVPVALGTIVNDVIPLADRERLVHLVLGVAAAGLSAALLHLARSVAVLRIATRATSTLQAAIWNRLLSLPASFFHGYTAGDLGSRVMGATLFKGLLSEAAVTSILTGVFAMVGLLVMLWYDVRLALVAGLCAAIGIAVAVVVSARQLAYQREQTALAGRISGTVLELLTGIATLRVAGAEIRAFGRWARDFASQRRLVWEARRAAVNLVTFNAAWPILTMVVILWLSAGLASRLSTGALLAFYAALGQLFAALVGLAGSLLLLVQVTPAWERMQPILTAAPETTPQKADPGELRGRIDVSSVWFRYQAGAPPILEDLSLSVEPGQFVAIVGPSGAGKSSLLRLLLHFEVPERGSITYDGKDLATLDVEAVRQQIGVVLQNGQLLAGSILSNILGASQLPVEAAWEAARIAGLDDDIRRMPMGMYTFVSEGGSTFSGGQRQRLLIARAVVARPRILLFDEATSALDNRTQDQVTDNLAQLRATRLGIAHRLSTVKRADRILVLSRGRVVQSGTFDELFARPGPFRDLAQRQLA